MPVESHPYISGEQLLSYLRAIFPKREVISSTELRDFLNISPSTDQRMRAQGQYPRTISLPGILREKRILLVDLAAWIERGGCPECGDAPRKKRGRGSEKWKQTHPAKQEAAPAESQTEISLEKLENEDPQNCPA